MDFKKELQNPKWWLIITALVHTFVGVLFQMDPDNDNELMISGIFLIIPVIMFYAAFMTEGRDRARLAAVVAGPIFVWFVLCIALGLEITYTTDAFSWELSDKVTPLVIWGMTALTGVLGWNSGE